MKNRILFIFVILIPSCLAMQTPNCLNDMYQFIACWKELDKKASNFCTDIEKGKGVCKIFEREKIIKDKINAVHILANSPNEDYRKAGESELACLHLAFAFNTAQKEIIQQKVELTT